MRLLLIKTSSLGDVIHTFPALSDARQAWPELRIDWVVEEAYADLAALHPAVDQVIPVALRRWRRQPWSASTRQAWAAYRQALRRQPYDRVIDAQGLLKSAFLMCQVPQPAVRMGYDRASLREPLAALFYQRHYSVARSMHAVERTRQLLAQALSYERQGRGRYGLQVPVQPAYLGAIWLLHGSTWPTKLWPLASWRALAAKLSERGHELLLPYGDAAEHERAQAIIDGLPGARLWPAGRLSELAGALAGARAVVGVDTGLSHLAAALDRPVLALFGATDRERTGIYGEQVRHLSAGLPCQPCLQERCRLQPRAEAGQAWPPCMAALTPDQVLRALEQLLQTGDAPAQLP